MAESWVARQGSSASSSRRIVCICIGELCRHAEVAHADVLDFLLLLALDDINMRKLKQLAEYEETKFNKLVDKYPSNIEICKLILKKLKKRKEPVNYEGRKYKDYLEFIQKNPTIPTTQMDTVYNQQEGPYIQTFIVVN